MAQACTVCTHEDAVLINEAIVVEGKSNRAIAGQFELSKSSIDRHKAHIPELLLQATRAREVYNAERIVEKVEDLEREALEQLEGAKGDKQVDRRMVLAAIREQRQNLETIARVLKIITNAPTTNQTINLYQSAEWIEVKTALRQALESIPPQYREPVFEALKTAEKTRAIEGNGSV